MNPVYTCPMHPEITSEKAGQCPKCGMALVPANSLKEASDKGLGKLSWKNYLPLIAIVSLILLVAVVVTLANPSWKTFISTFMIGFFLVFGGFKLLDLKGFAEGYKMYDLLAMRWPTYGYIYPFIEIFFGFAMILGLASRTVLWLEVLVMAFSGVGVLLKILKKERFQCVCLGTTLKVPLTTVTLIEDFGMAVLALILLQLI